MSSTNFNVQTVRILISRIRDGDDSALPILATQVQSYLRMMADKKLDHRIRQNLGVSDVVQMTLINMVNGIDKFNGRTPAEFFGWLNAIVKSVANKSFRDLTRQKRNVLREQSMHEQENESRVFGGLRDNEVTPQSAALSKENVQLFYLALSRLSADHATVIKLKGLEQLKSSEVAERMGRSENAVTKIWKRAMLNLAKELELLNEQSGK